MEGFFYNKYPHDIPNFKYLTNILMDSSFFDTQSEKTILNLRFKTLSVKYVY